MYKPNCAECLQIKYAQIVSLIYGIYYQNKKLFQMRNSIRQKENRPCLAETRLSLKMSNTIKKKLEPNEGRMSMLPLKRQRLSVGIQNQFVQPRPSVLKNNPNILNTCMNSNMSSLMNTCQRSIRKDTIINNLVNKLDEEQQIRSIIETKLRRNSYGPNKQFAYTSEFQPYCSNASFQSSQKNLTQQLSGLMQGQHSLNQDNAAMSKKLKKCQQQLEHFKTVINQMSKKMKNMQNKNNIQRENSLQPEEESFKASDRCLNCFQPKSLQVKKQPKNNFRKLKQMAVQTSPLSIQKQIKNRNEQSSNYEFDFFQNLDRTLNILNQNKQI